MPCITNVVRLPITGIDSPQEYDRSSREEDQGSAGNHERGNEVTKPYHPINVLKACSAENDGDMKT